MSIPEQLAMSTWAARYFDDVVPLAQRASVDRLEWDLDRLPLSIERTRLRAWRSSLQRAGLNVRFHLPHTSLDVAHAKQAHRRASVEYLKMQLDSSSEIANTLAVLHFGTTGDADERAAVDAIGELSDHAASRGIRLAVENLKDGISARCDLLQYVASECDVDVCFDVGHARACCGSDDGVLEIIHSLSDLISHAHVYKEETESRDHLLFASAGDVEEAGEVLDALSSCARCSWWTLEVETIEEYMVSRDLLAIRYT